MKLFSSIVETKLYFKKVNHVKDKIKENET